MTILGIDTATAVASVGIFDDGKVVSERSEFAPGEHARCLAELTGAVLDLAGVVLADLEGIAVSLGPGSFTGLRIGISFAKGIAYVGGQRLVGIPTLEALAAAEPTRAPWIATCLDARRGEVYLAMYRRTPDGLETAFDEQAVSPETAVREIAARVEGIGSVLVGDAAESYGEIFRPLAEGTLKILPFGEAHPRGGTVAALGECRLQNGEESSAQELIPHYVRAADAEIRASGLR